MSGLTCTLGGVSFGALNTSPGRKCIRCYVQALEYDTKRFHVPGTTGNFIVRGSRMGGKILAELAYIDVLGSVHSAFQSDRAAWENTAISITDSTGAVFTRCNLDNGGLRLIRMPYSLGRGSGWVRMDAAASYTVDSYYLP